MTNSISEANLLLSRVKCALEGRAQAKAALEVKPRDLSAIMGAAKEITRQAETLVAVFEKMGGLETLEALVSRASQPVDGTVGDVTEAPLLSERSVNAGVGHAPGSAARVASVTLISEAVERVIAEIDYQESAPEPKGRFATVRIDDLRALLSLAKPVGDWQPIETAPRGRWVLLRGRNSVGAPMVPVVARLGGEGWRDSAGNINMDRLVCDVPPGESADWHDLPAALTAMKEDDRG